MKILKKILFTVLVCATLFTAFACGSNDGLSEEQNEALLQMGNEYLNREEYAHAIDCYRQIGGGSEFYETAQTKLKKATNSFVDSVISKSEEYFKNGEYDSACDVLEEAKIIISDNADLNRECNEKHNARKDIYIDTVESYIDSHDFETALEVLKTAYLKMPSDEVLRYEIQDIYTGYICSISDSAINDATGNIYSNYGDYEYAVDVTKQASEILPENEKLASNYSTAYDNYISGIINQIESFVDSDKYSNAYELHNTATEKFPDDERLKSVYNTNIIKFEEYLTETTNAYMANGDYSTAFNLVDDALRYIPDNETVKSLYDTVYEGYVTHTIETAQSYVSTGEHLVAIELLKIALQDFPDEEMLNSGFNEIAAEYRTTIRNTANGEADEFIANGDYSSALKAIEQAIQILEGDDELQSRLEACKKQYADSVINTANAQYVRYNAASIFAAEDMIFEALQIMPDYPSLVEAYEKYVELEPKRVNYDSENVILTDPKTDNMGGTYDFVYRIYLYRGNRNASITLDYQWTRLTGTLFQNSKYKNANNKTTLTVETEKSTWINSVSGDTKPISFNLDVFGQDEITWSFSCDECNFGGSLGSSHYCDHAYIADLYLWDY